MMLAVKRVKLPASGWLNRQDKPLPRRGMFPVELGFLPPTVSQNGRTEKEETDRPFTVADLSATSGGAPMRYIGVASSIESNR